MGLHQGVVLISAPALARHRGVAWRNLCISNPETSQVAAMLLQLSAERLRDLLNRILGTEIVNYFQIPSRNQGQLVGVVCLLGGIHLGRGCRKHLPRSIFKPLDSSFDLSAPDRRAFDDFTKNLPKFGRCFNFH